MYCLLLQDLKLVWDGEKWEQPSPLEEAVFEKIVPAGTYVKGLEFLWYSVAEGQDAGFEFKSLYCTLQPLGQLNEKTGEVYFPSSSAGWNTSTSWYPIGRGCPKGCHPVSKKNLYTLKLGETLEDYPKFNTRENQLKWLEERKTNWFPEQETRIIKYVSEAKVLASSTLEEFCSLLNLSEEDLVFSEGLIDPGAEYRRQGFSLEMTDEEAYQKGRGLYHGFRWEYVKKKLESRKLRTQAWKSPSIWTKAQKVEKRRGKQQEFTKKWERSYTFLISTDIDTKEVFVSVQ